MPGLFHQPLDRRDFLKTSVLAGAGLVMAGCQSTSRSSLPASNEIRLALLSDTHIPGDCAKDPKGGFDPCQNLRSVAANLATNPPRAVILNGDGASREGLPADYQVLRSLLDPVSRVAPVYIGLGNHDDRQNFKDVFPSPVGWNTEVKNRHILVIEESFIRFVVLDSLLFVNTMSGMLGHVQRWWLTEYLKSHREKPIVLFVHHTLGDSDGDLFDAGRLFEIIRPHRQVKAIFYGHSHVWGTTERQGVRLINLPALGYNFTKNDPVGWVDARFHRRGVDLTLHAIAGNREKDGQLSRIGWS